MLREGLASDILYRMRLRFSNQESELKISFRWDEEGIKMSFIAPLGNAGHPIFPKTGAPSRFNEGGFHSWSCEL